MGPKERGEIELRGHIERMKTELDAREGPNKEGTKEKPKTFSELEKDVQKELSVLHAELRDLAEQMRANYGRYEEKKSSLIKIPEVLSKRFLSLQGVYGSGTFFILKDALKQTVEEEDKEDVRDWLRAVIKNFFEK